MDLNKILRTGHEVRVKNEKCGFVTCVDEIVGCDVLSILAPADAEQRLLMKKGEPLLLTCVTERGLYMFETRIVETYVNQAVMTVELKAVSDLKKIQRREAFRAQESIEVSVRRKRSGEGGAEKWLNTSTVDFSERGVQIRYTEECPVGQPVELVLRVDKFGIREVLSGLEGRVVRCLPSGNKRFGYFLGVEFENLPDKARDVIIKLVVLSQRSKLTYQYTKRYR